MAVEFQIAGIDDFTELHLLRLAAMKESLTRLGRYDPERSRQRFAASFQPECTTKLCRDQKLVGFYMLRRNDEAWQLDHLYLHPDEQRQGLGSQVLGQLCAEADHAACAIEVGALRDSASNRFYQRYGFKLQREDEWDLHYRREPSTP